MSQTPHSPSSYPLTKSLPHPNPQTLNESSTTTTTTDAIHPPSPNATFIGDMARTYSQRTGGCNILLAKQLINLIIPSLPPLPPPPTSTTADARPTLRILDNACGPMILTRECLSAPAIVASDRYATVHVSAVDLSPDFIAYNQTLLSSLTTTTTPPAAAAAASPKLNIDTALMDSTSLSFPRDTFDLSFTALALFAFPSPAQGVRELHRTLKPGGATACTTWKSVGWLPLLHELETELFSSPSSSSSSTSADKNQQHAAVPLTTFPFLTPWAVPGKLASVLREGGFSRVEETEIDAIAWWGSGDECAYWVTETLWLMVGMREGGARRGGGWGDGEGQVGKEGLRVGFRGVLEKRIRRGDGDEGGNQGVVVVRGEGGRVGIRMVAFAGLGWK